MVKYRAFYLKPDIEYAILVADLAHIPAVDENLSPMYFCRIEKYYLTRLWNASFFYQ